MLTTIDVYTGAITSLSLIIIIIVIWDILLSPISLPLFHATILFTRARERTMAPKFRERDVVYSVSYPHAS